MKTPDYLSYEKYKKKKNTNPNKRLFIFVTTFFATLLLFSVTAKQFSPDVDVTIGEETETDAKETGLGVKRFIDERLKMIQMDDNSAGASRQESAKKVTETKIADAYSEYADIAEEKINLPTKKGKQTQEVNEEPVMPEYSAPPKPKTKDLAVSYESTRVSKVYVGRYATMEQARVAQEILMDSGVNVSPFIKDMGGSYTLQLGSYSSRAKAEDLAAELRRNSFPARVVQE